MNATNNRRINANIELKDALEVEFKNSVSHHDKMKIAIKYRLLYSVFLADKYEIYFDLGNIAFSDNILKYE